MMAGYSKYIILKMKKNHAFNEGKFSSAVTTIIVAQNSSKVSPNREFKTCLQCAGKVILPWIMQLGLSLPAIPKSIPPQLPYGCSEVTWYVKVRGVLEVGRVNKSCPIQNQTTI